MPGDEVRQVCEAMLPQDVIDRLCQACGGIERQRTLKLGMWVRALVIAAGTPGGAYQADVWRASLAGEVPRVTRAACSRGFDAPLEPCMAALAERAPAYARAQEVDRPGVLSGVQDWSSVDATTVRVRDALIEDVPGTGDDAALNVHTVLSVGCGAPVRSHVSPAREHDRRQLTVDESWRGCGLLADRGSASLARLRACAAHEVRCVRRRKDTWTPKVGSSARGQVTQACFPGTALEALLEQETLVLAGRAMDADVHRGGAKPPLPLRLIGIQSPKGDGVFLTHLPPRLGPRQVADRSRVRWEVEISQPYDDSRERVSCTAA